MIIRKSALLFLLGACLLFQVRGQETVLHIDETSEFRRGLDLLEKEKYGTAQIIFQQISEDENYPDGYIRSLAQYYVAYCAVRLFNDDAEHLTYQFVGDNPESPLVNEAYFNLAGYFYARKRWRQAIEYYLKTDADRLNKDQWSEYYFKLGYSYFTTNQFDEAKPVFYQIKDVNTRYTPHALYYYSHIHYEEKNYQTALNGFLRLLHNRSFGSIAPYYIVQIYYKQGRYEELVGFAPGIMNQIAPSRLDEVARITAEAFSELGRYGESVPYYRTYLDSADYVRKEDKYQAGYAFYKAGSYTDAVYILGEISNVESELGQNASYYLADCYLKMDDKENARLAFQSAARYNFDPVIRQDAKFNYALLCYELGDDPFNEAIGAFEEFIREYPDSKRTAEAYNLLVQAYLSTRNYHQALLSLEKNELKTPELKKAYQRVAYFRGIQLFNNLQYPGAILHFDKSLKHGSMDNSLRARALYWKAEASYRTGDYAAAVAGYKAFKQASIAYTLPEYDIVDYNIGYAYFKQKNYARAVESFRKFNSEAPVKLAEEKSDALLRIGDCFFAQSQYYAASDYYQKATAEGVGADYALFQRALCEGLEGRDMQKIQILTNLLNSYAGSSYQDDAYYEMAQSYLKMQNVDRAITTLRKLIDEQPMSPHAPNAMVQLGLLSYNRNDVDEALRYYKQAIAKYPGTQAANDALIGLRNIYVHLDRVDEYASYVNSLGTAAPVVSADEQDSLNYISAEKLFRQGNYAESSRSLKRYITNYPNGRYLLDAHILNADCNMKLGNHSEALTSYRYLLNQPQNQYTEPSLLAAARLEFENGDYRNAILHYKQLEAVYASPMNTKEARIALMQSYYKLRDYQEALKASRQVSELDKLPPEISREASYIAARSLEELGRDVLAIEEYMLISDDVSSEQGAEAKYKIAELYFKRGNLEEAEKEIVDFAKKGTSIVYWYGRTYILWAEIDAMNGKHPRAVKKLQSIIDNYEEMNDGVLDLAKQRKTQYMAVMEANEQPMEDEEVEINME